MRKVVVVLLSLAAHAASALPNLQVIEAKHFASGCLNVEQAYHGSGTVKNGGDVAAQNFKVLIIMYGEDSFFKRERVTDDDLLAMYYEKSDDPRIRDSMFLKEVASLVPGETRTFEVDRTLPADAPCQRYGLRVIADVDNAVAESSEEDNAKNGIPYFPCKCPEAAPSSTPTAALTPTITSTPTVTGTAIASPTHSPTITETATVTNTGAPTATATLSPTATASATVTNTGAPTATQTGTATLSPTATSTSTVTASATVTNTGVPTATQTGTATASATNTASPTASPSATVTNTGAPTVTVTPMGKPNVTVWFELLDGDLSPLPEGSCLEDLHIHALLVHVSNIGSVAVEDVALKITSVQEKDVQVFANLFGKDHETVLEGPLAPNQEKVWTIRNDPFHPICAMRYGATVIVDPDDLIDEENENDNQAGRFLLEGCCPVETPTPTVSPTITATASPTHTETDEPTVTMSPTATWTSTPTPTKTGALEPTATWTTVSPTATVTPTETRGFCDRGFYLLDIFGQLHRAGSPPVITGSITLPGGNAMGAEKVRTDEDIAVLDGMGVVTFVSHPENTPMQDFLFQPSPAFPLGRAVDLAVTPSGEGFWVLTDFGGIYRAGTAKVTGQGALVPHTDELPLGYDIMFGPMRRPGFPNPGGASLRAVSLGVINPDGDDQANGYIILDSQGGRFLLNGDGSTVAPGTYANRPPDDPLKLLDSPTRLEPPDAYIWPFFAGMDIARDLELHPSQKGLVVFDGWGGIHPVPVDRVSNPVFYTRNDDPNDPGNLITTVGMPYIVEGFDNPETPQDEGNENIYGVDAESIFTGFNFSPGCQQGFYTLDEFGGVAVFGGVRRIPDNIDSPFSSPYFFPFMHGKKLVIY